VIGLNLVEVEMCLYSFFEAVILSFHFILQIITIKISCFPNIYNHVSLLVATASGANVDPTSPVRSPAMLVLLIVGILTERF
jgi:hypothetical protein